MEKTQFNPKSGYFTIELPYYSIAKKLKVKKTKEGKYLLSKDISDLMSCNNNKICETRKILLLVYLIAPAVIQNSAQKQS